MREDSEVEGLLEGLRRYATEIHDEKRWEDITFRSDSTCLHFQKASEN